MADRECRCVPSERDYLEREADELRARVAELEAALKPIAKACAEAMRAAPKAPEDRLALAREDVKRVVLTLAHVERAE